MDTHGEGGPRRRRDLDARGRRDGCRGSAGHLGRRCPGRPGGAARRGCRRPAAVRRLRRPARTGTSTDGLDRWGPTAGAGRSWRDDHGRRRRHDSGCPPPSPRRPARSPTGPPAPTPRRPGSTSPTSPRPTAGSSYASSTGAAWWSPTSAGDAPRGARRSGGCPAGRTPTACCSSATTCLVTGGADAADGSGDAVRSGGRARPRSSAGTDLYDLDLTDPTAPGSTTAARWSGRLLSLLQYGDDGPPGHLDRPARPRLRAAPTRRPHRGRGRAGATGRSCASPGSRTGSRGCDDGPHPVHSSAAPTSTTPRPARRAPAPAPSTLAISTCRPGSVGAARAVAVTGAGARGLLLDRPALRHRHRLGSGADPLRGRTLRRRPTVLVAPMPRPRTDDPRLRAGRPTAPATSPPAPSRAPSATAGRSTSTTGTCGSRSRGRTARAGPARAGSSCSTSAATELVRGRPTAAGSARRGHPVGAVVRRPGGRWSPSARPTRCTPIDLRRPRPVRAASGELKIPGFSSYLHPIGERPAARAWAPTPTSTAPAAAAPRPPCSTSPTPRAAARSTRSPSAGPAWLAAAEDPHAFTWLPERQRRGHHRCSGGAPTGPATRAVAGAAAGLAGGTLSHRGSCPTRAAGQPRALPLDDGRVALVGERRAGRRPSGG